MDELLASMDTRTAGIIRCVYGIGCPQMTLEECGRIFRLTKERVRQITRDTIKKLEYSPMADTLKNLI